MKLNRFQQGRIQQTILWLLIILLLFPLLGFPGLHPCQLQDFLQIFTSSLFGLMRCARICGVYLLKGPGVLVKFREFLTVPIISLQGIIKCRAALSGCLMILIDKMNGGMIRSMMIGRSFLMTQLLMNLVQRRSIDSYNGDVF